MSNTTSYSKKEFRAAENIKVDWSPLSQNPKVGFVLTPSPPPAKKILKRCRRGTLKDFKAAAENIDKVDWSPRLLLQNPNAGFGMTLNTTFPEIKQIKHQLKFEKLERELEKASYKYAKYNVKILENNKKVRGFRKA